MDPCGPDTPMPVQPKMMIFGKAKMTFSALTNKTDTPTGTVFVQNLGVGVLSFTASKSKPWITLSQTSGQAPDSLDIGVNTTGLAPGIYAGKVTLTAGPGLYGAQPEQAIIEVTLEVLP